MSAQANTHAWLATAQPVRLASGRMAVYAGQYRVAGEAVHGFRYRDGGGLVMFTTPAMQRVVEAGRALDGEAKP